MSSRPRLAENSPLGLILVSTLYALAFLLGGLVFGWWIVQELAAASRTSNWPQAQATITAGDIKTSARFHYPEVEYRFEVNGKPYTGHRIMYWSDGTDRAGAAAVLRRYPVGSRHPARYDPVDPGSCVLEPGVDSRIWPWMVLPPVILIALGAAMTCKCIRILFRRFSFPGE